MHTPCAQTGAPMTQVHRCPHAPQFLTSVRTLVSQPFAGFPSQSPNPAKQAVMTHCPFTHPGTAFGAVHTRPQAPQLATLELVSTQTPLQSGVGLWQPHPPAPLQTPLEHGVPTGSFSHTGWPVMHLGT